MGGAKTARKYYTFEELKEKSVPALSNPKLVEIAKTASLNKDGRVNLTSAYDQAFQYVYEETKDLKKAKELAVATRWLAMIRRNYEEGFEKLVSQKESERKVEESDRKRSFYEMEFILPSGTELITKEVIWSFPNSTTYAIRFQNYMGYRFAREFCMKILNALLETGDDSEKKLIADELIKILEEKLRLKIRICGNCKYAKIKYAVADAGRVIGGAGYCHYNQTTEELCPVIDYHWDACADWTLLQEASEGIAKQTPN